MVRRPPSRQLLITVPDDKRLASLRHGSDDDSTTRVHTSYQLNRGENVCHDSTEDKQNVYHLYSAYPRHTPCSKRFTIHFLLVRNTHKKWHKGRESSQLVVFTIFVDNDNVLFFTRGNLLAKRPSPMNYIRLVPLGKRAGGRSIALLKKDCYCYFEQGGIGRLPEVYIILFMKIAPVYTQ